MKNPNDSIGNRTRKLSFRSAVPQQNVPPCIPLFIVKTWKIFASFKESPPCGKLRH